MQSRPKLRLEATWRGRVPIEARSSAQSESEYRAGDPNLKGIAFCAPIPAAIAQEICPNHSGGTRSFRCLESLFSSARRKSCQMFAGSSSRKLLTSAKFTKRASTRQEFCPSHSFSSVVGYADKQQPAEAFHDADRNQGAVDRSARRHCLSHYRSRMRGGCCRSAHRSRFQRGVPSPD